MKQAINAIDPILWFLFPLCLALFTSSVLPCCFGYVFSPLSMFSFQHRKKRKESEFNSSRSLPRLKISAMVQYALAYFWHKAKAHSASISYEILILSSCSRRGEAIALSALRCFMLPLFSFLDLTWRFTQGSKPAAHVLA